MSNVVLKLILNDAFSYKCMNKNDAYDLMKFLIDNDITIEIHDKELLDGMEVISNLEKVNAFIIFHGEEHHSDIDLIQLISEKNKILLDEDNLQIVFKYTSEILSYYFTDEDGIEVPKTKKLDDESGIYITVDKNSKLIIKLLTMKEYEALSIDDIELFLTWKELWEQYEKHGLYKIIYE